MEHIIILWNSVNDNFEDIVIDLESDGSLFLLQLIFTFIFNHNIPIYINKRRSSHLVNDFKEEFNWNRVLLKL